MNFLSGRLAAISDGTVEVELDHGGRFAISANAPANAAAGDTVTVGIRPEHTSINGATDDMPAEVEVVERLGSQTQFGLRVGSGSLVIAAAFGPTPAKTGDIVTLSFDRQHLHVCGRDEKAFPRAQLPPEAQDVA